MIELTEQQRRELDADPPCAVDPLTRRTWVLVSEDVYQCLQHLLLPERMTGAEQQAILRAAGKARVGTIRRWTSTTGRGQHQSNQRYNSLVPANEVLSQLPEVWFV